MSLLFVLGLAPLLLRSTLSTGRRRFLDLLCFPLRLFFLPLHSTLSGHPLLCLTLPPSLTLAHPFLLTLLLGLLAPHLLPARLCSQLPLPHLHPCSHSPHPCYLVIVLPCLTLVPYPIALNSSLPLAPSDVLQAAVYPSALPRIQLMRDRKRLRSALPSPESLERIRELTAEINVKVLDHTSNL